MGLNDNDIEATLDVDHDAIGHPCDASSTTADQTPAPMN
jgi:hypothetical protein